MVTPFPSPVSESSMHRPIRPSGVATQQRLGLGITCRIILGALKRQLTLHKLPSSGFLFDFLSENLILVSVGLGKSGRKQSVSRLSKGIDAEKINVK